MTKEDWRFITPILVTIAIAVNTIVLAVVSDTNQKLFRHLTNDEIHTPKSMVVTKAEFQIYQQLRQQQMDTVSQTLGEIKGLIRDHVKSVGSSE